MRPANGFVVLFTATARIRTVRFRLEQVVARYKAEGYDFICVTDHFRPEFNYPITDLSVFNDDVFLTIPSAELHIMATSYGKLCT